ncbi:MAG: tetraacyldisaccharide 4'-kinase, partial [Flavobacterium sp.]|nr:tetraacyldisaccharide 4'-kinase [Flavobacterium sp.]
KIITTEKDFVRLNGLLPKEQLFYLPIKSVFLNNKNIDKTIKDYVGKGSRNS